jgi:hypothetical protein
MTPERGPLGPSDVRAATRTSGCLDHRGKSFYPVMEQLQIGVLTSRSGLDDYVQTHIGEASFSESFGDFEELRQDQRTPSAA